MWVVDHNKKNVYVGDIIFENDVIEKNVTFDPLSPCTYFKNDYRLNFSSSARPMLIHIRPTVIIIGLIGYPTGLYCF